MNILDRYLLKEFFRPFVVCLFAFVFCMVIYDLYGNISDFVESGMLWNGEVFHYYLTKLPAMVVVIMPVAVLLALLYALSTLSKHNEITAMRAGGLDLLRLLSPYFAVGICISMQMLSLNLAWAPNADQAAKEILDRNIKKKEGPQIVVPGVIFANYEKNRFWSISLLDTRQLRATGIEITQCNDKDEDLKKISAMDGVFQRGYWTLRNVIIYDYTLPPSNPESLQRLQVYRARELNESPALMVEEIKKTRRLTTEYLIKELHYAKRLPTKKVAMYSTELHSRISWPLANLVVFLIGVPFGVLGQRSSNFMAIANALVFFFAYYFFTQLMTNLASTGKIIPWIAAWLPNAFFSISGFWMMLRMR